MFNQANQKMSTIDEVKEMQSQGIPEEEIITRLREKGYPYRDISEAMAQTKIKAAVEAPQSDPNGKKQKFQQPTQQEPIMPQDSQQNQTPLPEQQTQGMPGMQQSILPSPSTQEQSQEYISNQFSEDQYPQQYQDYRQTPYGYSEYEYQQPGISADTITEISEQIVTEKMSDIRKHLEKIMEFRTTMETKTELLEERLKRIEKIIDTLQSSVLRKVGDYITNVDDIKKELIETQKTFAKIAGTSHHSHHKTHKTTRKSSKKKK